MSLELRKFRISARRGRLERPAVVDQSPCIVVAFSSLDEPATTGGGEVVRCTEPNRRIGAADCFCDRSSKLNLLGGGYSRELESSVRPT